MAERVENNEHEQINPESSCSESEVINDELVSENPGGFSGNGLIRLEEEDEKHSLLKHRLYTSLGSLAQHCTVVAAHMNTHSTSMGRARLEAFQIYSKAMKEKRDGNPTVRYAWYGSSKSGIHRIIDDGFDICGMPEGSGFFGFGLHLSPESSAIDSVMSSTVDGDGLRYLMLCRVTLGNMEEVPLGSRQFHPSSEKFDSGVDNQQSPKKYLVWYPNVNTHILPLYVLSIKLDLRSRGLQRVPVRRPVSPWIPLTPLISVLSESLSPSAMCLIRRCHNAYMENKSTRQQLILQIRKLSGDKLLIAAIKSFQDKKLRKLKDKQWGGVDGERGDNFLG